MNNYLKILIIFLLTISFNTVVIASPGDKESRFMRFFDSNHDNKVTVDELNQASKKRFTEMDTDSNNLVSSDEFKNHIQQRRQKRRTRIYNGIDVDSDGLMTEDEFLTFKYKRATERFHQMDIDEDGIISLEEFTTAKPRRHGKRFKGKRGHRIFSKLDANSNGQITRDESLAAWTNWFNRIDENKDKIVTTDEVQMFRNKKW